MKSSLSKIVLVVSTVFLYSPVFSAEKGSELFDQKCSACHLKVRPSFDQINTMVAPPIKGVMFHVTEAKPSREEAVKFMVDYIFEPERSKALCINQSIERFGLMPSQKGSLTKEEAKIIAEYLYNTYK